MVSSTYRARGIPKYVSEYSSLIYEQNKIRLGLNDEVEDTQLED